MKLKRSYVGNSDQTCGRFLFLRAAKKAGVKEPIKQKVTKDEESATLDESGLSLREEVDDSIFVFDTCNEVRRKVAAYLREPGVTQAAFLRQFAKMLPDPTVNFQSKQLKDFQPKNGPLAGNMSRIYYAPYTFFEKRRVLKGKPRSKQREESEQVWAWRAGIDRERQEKVLCLASSPTDVDRWGQSQSLMSMIVAPPCLT